MHILIDKKILNISSLSQYIKPSSESGGVASFAGYMRNFNAGQTISAMFLDHYPDMTNAVLENIAQSAEEKWPLHNGLIAHRVGQVKPGDLLVYVEVHSAHRQEAFDACNYIMDVLKTSAPFWKKETTDTGEHWVEQRDSDLTALTKWQ